MLPSKFEVNWPFGSAEEAKNRFQDGCQGGHLGFPISMILATFELQVTLMLPSKFGVNWPFGSGEEAKNRFSRWLPSWISDWHDFSYFWSTSPPMLPNKFGVNWPLASGEKAKNRFSRWRPWPPSWISDRRMILVIFYLQVIPMLPTKYQVNWPRGVGEVGF